MEPMESTALTPTRPSKNGNTDTNLSYDTDILISYFRNVCQVLLGAATSDLDRTIFSDTSNAVTQLATFAGDVNIAVLFVEKSRVEDDISDLEYTYTLSPMISPTKDTISLIAVIKRASQLDVSISMESQLQVVNLPNVLSEAALKQKANDEMQISGTAGTPYDVLYSLVHLALVPFFDAFTRGKGSILGTNENEARAADAKTGIPATKKRLTELELSLLHLQQNIEIPQLTLTFHPAIQQVLDKATKLDTTPTLDFFSPELLNDAKFLNQVQANVNSWIKSIQSITKLTRDPSIGSATQEINFWISLESVLEDIDRQLQMDGVTLTMEVLKHGKRFIVTTSFLADTGLKESLELVKKYNLLMHEFPIDELLSASTLQKLKEAVVHVFNHLNRRIKISPYPIHRALHLVEAISGDLDARFHALLSGRRLMHLEYPDFQKIVSVAEDVFAAWDYQIKEFTNVAREVTRKRLEKFIPIRITARHNATQERLQYLKSFRQAHEKLQSTVATVLGGSKEGSSEDTDDVVQDLVEAYSALRDVDVLDVSPEGSDIWASAESAYNERTSRIEDSIIIKLRDHLANAKTANEMFIVFSRFNALFIRNKIRAAVQEYQTQLIDSVKSDIEALHDRFIAQYPNSGNYQMAKLRDIPPVAGAIIWVRQIERQLNLYMKRVEDVLGSGWGLYAEGEKLQNESNTFRKKLDAKGIFDAWLRDVTERHIAVKGRLFSITRSRSTGTTRLEITTNFDPQIIALFKEVRNLTYLKFQIPHAINSVSKDAKRVYPHAMSMTNSLRIFSDVTLIIEELGAASALMNEYQNAVQSLILTGKKLDWQLFAHAYDVGVVPSYVAGDDSTSVVHESPQIQFARNLTNSISVLERKAFLLSAAVNSIGENLQALRDCAYSATDFTALIENIQSAIDKLNLESFANLTFWVDQLNTEIYSILLARLREAISQWIAHFHGDHKSTESDRVITIEIVIKDQAIALQPPLEHARAIWFGDFQACLVTLCQLKRIDSARYELTLDQNMTFGKPETEPLTFSDLPTLAAADIEPVYNAIEEKLADVSTYTAKWYQFQSLWNLQPESVFRMLGDDLTKWIDVLQDIRKVRSTFDTAVSSYDFGNIIVDYEQVQSRINAKYDGWQHDILMRFAEILQSDIERTHKDLDDTRRELEIQTLDMLSTKRAIAFVTIVQRAKAKSGEWAESHKKYRMGQMALQKNRFRFPFDWIFVEQISGEMAAVSEILSVKDRTVMENIDSLRSKVTSEHKLLNDQVARTVSEWNSEKPVAGNISPDVAFASLEKFDRRITALKAEQDLILRANDALELDLRALDTIESSLQEVQDFKTVWSALSSVWASLNELRDTPWLSVVGRRVKTTIEELIATTKEMPSRMRQYASFEYVQGVLRQYLKGSSILIDLKSEVMKVRHWEHLYRTLAPKETLALGSLTLGDVWDLNLTKNENLIRDILTQARGEAALEDFLKQIRDVWSSYDLDLANYQDKCRLIRGWDALFDQCTDHMNSLAAMHHSPYFKQFEEEALAWEEKLSRINLLFDSWIEVQRKWVYLEGVFSDNAEIKNLLPVESSRFQNVNSEFFALMRKVSKNPNVLHVLNIPGTSTSLSRLADMLTRVQKALGEYLERERMLFPRYYFVGDEDLLEIIGNSKDTVRIQKHFKKMFAGISDLVVDSQNSTISGFSSKEGETVMLKEPISLIKNPKVNEWLRSLEEAMRETLATLLVDAIEDFRAVFRLSTLTAEQFTSWVQRYPAQVVILASQIVWTSEVDNCLLSGGGLSEIGDHENLLLELLAGIVLQELDRIDRKKCEGLITELVHQRNVVEKLVSEGAKSKSDYAWLATMTFRYSEEQEDVKKRVTVHMGSAQFEYGFEYLGVGDRLVQTPLTDKCFLALMGALEQNFGGSPFGPAGTGKTETVKALGSQLGRFVLVFNCDDTFNFEAMGRIFLGICQVGAWGCFDEFNRLEERILSAISSQIQAIQLGLQKAKSSQQDTVEILGKEFVINQDTGIFITMNPGYSGRSNLPDNLKKLFRSVSMSRPDKELITEVVLYTQGFVEAKDLAVKIVPFFNLLAKRLTKQPHYDFGLRALKSVLASSGELKRRQALLDGETDSTTESEVIIQSIHETIAPKLLEDDALELTRIEQEVFPGVEYKPEVLQEIQEQIVKLAVEDGLVVSDAWLVKALQLYQIQNIHHGIMLVGNSGSGKSAIWKTLLRAMQATTGMDSAFYIIDAKVMSKEKLYGSLDSTTREWTDGLFTSILRKINDNLRGESTKRHWIVFDGDVDPEWVENLNSVLDDNRILTLPNGERLALLPNIRILFEVENLRHATLATVSRCGMVWLGADTVSTSMMARAYIHRLRKLSPDDSDSVDFTSLADNDKLLNQIVNYVELLLVNRGSWLNDSLAEVFKYSHIMEFSTTRALQTLLSLTTAAVYQIVEYDSRHPDFPLGDNQRETYLLQKLLLNTIWSFAGDCPLQEREQYGVFVTQLDIFTSLELPAGGSIIDYDTSLPLANWVPWLSSVPQMDLDPHMVTETDIVIPTIDTLRHESLLHACLQQQRPMILCGPPGSGKTMSLFNTLRTFANVDTAALNFSSSTTPELIIKTLEQYCEYKKLPSGFILAPTQIGRRLVVFCDEINLPAPDTYGTQRTISFMRQLFEQNGFWRTSDRSWISLERVQFVGACNPPTDAGRTPLGYRFLNHTSLVMIDYPGEVSLNQIYGTFIAAVLKSMPPLRGYGTTLTSAMVDLYTKAQSRFTAREQSHYVYSPRELTRWMKGIHEAVQQLDGLNLEGLVRIWAHEAIRLFCDRLVTEQERLWMDDAIAEVAETHFLNIDRHAALGGPILFSNWLSNKYEPVSLNDLREYTNARLQTFCEEELDVPLVLYDDALDHILRIDRVFRQPQGHLILIGLSGSGKNTLTRFVAWMNGLRVFQINAHKKYNADDFDEDLRTVLRNSGCKGQKICFILDESNVLQTAFLERMNTLLANAEIPGLFEGDEYTNLLSACREGSRQQGLMLSSPEELYSWFRGQIIRNLHVVFTMNPPKEGLSSHTASSPALFNRCVLNWMGDWSDSALYQVSSELVQNLDIDRQDYSAPNDLQVAYRGLPMPPTYKQAILNAMIQFHMTVKSHNDRIFVQQRKVNYATPRQFLEFVTQFGRIINEKREEVEEQQRHLNVGLEKLQDTVEKVRHLRTGLAEKREQLQIKSTQANDKLQQMVSDQKEAELRQAESLKIQIELETQEKEVASRQAIVLEDLAQAEPMVVEAQQSVSNIKKQHLTEVRSMANPPEAVKMAMEAVCILLGHKVDNWRSVQSIIRRDDFISSIINYDTDRQMTKSLRNKIQAEYLSRPNFNFETVNRASKACGPLTVWLEAQVNYSFILERIGPLREEVAELTVSAEKTKEQLAEMATVVQELETSIEKYKEEYAVLISEVQEIKSEMTKVENKVNRSIKLLSSLASERERWRMESLSFEEQTKTLSGDALLAAALIVYGGFFDQKYRQQMQQDWQLFLRHSDILLKDFNPVVDYMCPMTKKNDWHNNSLPGGELYEENALMIERSSRYPLIIDPTGRVVDFLRSQNPGLVVASFLDDAFVKQLESALRFGNALLVNDAEHFDPILNQVLKKEYQRVGGRILIQLGRQEIDFSPNFNLFLCSRDSSAVFSPDICSRTTLVNFTVTRSNLQAQSLNDSLKVLRPEVDRRQNNLVKLRRDFKVHLRQLEQSLLKALNESKGNILDDDNVINTLENLKVQSADIAEKMTETEGVMTKIAEIAEQYQPIAAASSTIYAIQELLQNLNQYYQFSLQFFQNGFYHVLSAVENIKDVPDLAATLKQIVVDLYRESFKRTSQGLLHKDTLTLAVFFAYANANSCDISFIESLFNKEEQLVDLAAESYEIPQLLEHISGSRVFEQYAIADQDSLMSFLNKSPADEENDIDEDLCRILLMKLVRSEKYTQTAAAFVSRFLGPDFLSATADNLSTIVSREASSDTPVILCSRPGYDASHRIDSLVRSSSNRCVSIAMGSDESIASAERAIAEAAQRGSWVLLKNVHLAPEWVSLLEKRIGLLRLESSFRLFLTMEMTTSKAPVSLLRASYIIMCEPPPGLRASMNDTFGGIPKTELLKPPVERVRVYFLLAWFHGVVQERLRYGIVGWKKAYEFSDADFEFARLVVDRWVSAAAGDESRSNVAPEKIPWTTILRILVDTVYGGKVDDEDDLCSLEKLASEVFTAQAFEIDFDITAGRAATALRLPEGGGVDGFVKWVDELPENEPPTWLGLGEDVASVV
ncbi:dynein heavy chain, N-terminal region 1-domain-containing protein [Myxozyma melibiosi]|uniref:Dynein heavy chain, cytoplasmic n=1 Tax=Myxozyma melibiosi TaxID=54550 RepID=A0ABR1FCJ8_9ASCO